MKKKQVLYKSILSIVLLVILLTPRFIKITHFLYIPHSHNHVEKPYAPTITNIYHSCHICAYKFAEIIDDGIVSLDFTNDYYLIDLQTYIISVQKILNYSFSESRAPPSLFCY